MASNELAQVLYRLLLKDRAIRAQVTGISVTAATVVINFKDGTSCSFVVKA